jgi:hypothetical protein
LQPTVDIVLEDTHISAARFRISGHFPQRDCERVIDDSALRQAPTRHFNPRGSFSIPASK